MIITMTYKRHLDFNLANFFYVLGLWEFFFNVDVMMIPGLLASKAYSCNTDFGNFNVTILVFVAFFVLFSGGACISVVVMMMLALR